MIGGLVITKGQKNVFRLLFFCFSMYGYLNAEEFQVQAQSHEELPFLVVLQGLHDAALEEVAQTIVHDLGFTKQFAPTQRILEDVPDRSTFKEFLKDGYLLVLFITSCDNADGIEWRLYDAGMGTMLKGKRYHKKGTAPRGWGHDIATSVWPLLTGEPGFFSARIAYCKQVRGKRRLLQHICLADYDGTHEEALVTTPTVNTMPRWSSTEPVIFYSEHGLTNVALMRVNMHGNKTKTSSMKGITMQPAFSTDGKTVVFCASKGTGDCQLYRYDKDGMKQITHNKGVNFAPSLSGNGQKVFFCSDFEGTPNIYGYDLSNQQLLKITSEGYCMSPSYHERRGLLAYTKKVKGVFQIFVFDVQKGTHKQLTHSAGQKEECSWSPCGNYVIFSVVQGTSSRIALFNVLTCQERVISQSGAQCSYPSWSALYEEFPVLSR